jgi:conserved protein with predicted RNA binding PUA domain
VESHLRRIRSIADYQYGLGVGERLFPDDIEIEYSHNTGRIRFITLKGERIATLRPTDSLLSLSINAAKTMRKNVPDANCYVTVQQDVSKFIADGGDVFATHIVKADPEVHPKDEVIVLDEKGDVLAVGRAFLSAEEMLAFKTGVAVKVRHGSS